jgi:glucosamine--fructose-6-phosphate aminotransferase (isomerizing)
MAMLLLIGSKLAERRQRITRAEAKRLEDIVLQATEEMAATLEACSCPARAWAVEFVEAQNILFLGSGPCYGTAVNASARIMEASGKSASAQDIEEWVHLERWVADKSLPVVLIVPAGPAMDRAIEVARALKALGKPCLAVTDSAHVEQFSSFAATVLPVRCSLPEELAPLVYNLPTELVADYLSIAGSKTPYCGDDVLYNQLGEPRSGGFVRKTVPPVGLPIGCV